jgi:hypothetical protein
VNHYRLKLTITGPDTMARHEAIRQAIEALQQALATDSTDFIIQTAPGYIAHVNQKGPKP